MLFALSAGELVVAQFVDPRLVVRERAARARARDRRRLERRAERRDALRAAASERHGDAAPPLDLPHRPARALRSGRRPGEPAPGRRSRSSVRCCLLIVYGVWLVGYLRSDLERELALEEPTHDELLPFALGARPARRRRRRRRTRLGMVCRFDQPRRREARDLQGVHRPRDRRDRRQRGRERGRQFARERRAKSDLADLRRQELGRPDRLVPLPRARARLAALRPAADLRRQPRLRRRARSDRDFRLADHGRRRGGAVRRLGADRAVRRARDDSSGSNS